MKRIDQFIKEAYLNEDEGSDVEKVHGLKVTYSFAKRNLNVCVSSSMSESDMQIYIDDKMLDFMPGSSDNSKKFLGDNIKDITDAYFQYDGFEASDNTTRKVDIEWDPKYGEDSDSPEYIYYYLKDFKYIIEFSEFSIKDTNDIEGSIEEIFKSLESNNINRYPIDIKFEKVEYEEQ